MRDQKVLSQVSSVGINADRKTSINDVNNRVQDNLGVARRLYQMFGEVRDEFYGSVPRPASADVSGNSRSGALPAIYDKLSETADILQQMEDEMNILRRDLFGDAEKRSDF